MNPLWIHLDFPLLALERHYPQAPAQVREQPPGALLDRPAGRVLLANPAAQAAGVTAGMAVASACSRCPELRLYHASPPQEQAQLEQLALWAGRFSAQVALQPPRGLLLEAGSMTTLFGGLDALCRHIDGQLQDLSFSSCLATGHTPLAAALLARSGGFIATTADQHRQRLEALPLASLALKPEITQSLEGMGIDTLGKLLALPRDALAPRFGPALLTTLDRLCGHRPDPPSYFQPPARFDQRLELEQELENAPALLFPLRRLLESLEGFLHIRQQRALVLQIHLSSREGTGPRLEIGHREGAWRAREWLELCRLRLERERLSQPVIALTLRVERLREQGPCNPGLFEEPSPTGALLSRLQSRLGEGQLHRLGAVADHRPERSWQLLPLDREVPPLPGIPGRPGWLLRTPKRLGPDPWQRIERLRGPERIVSGWWDGAPVRRDYYQGRWPDGRLGWLFRDDRGHWFLHGWFG